LTVYPRDSTSNKNVTALRHGEKTTDLLPINPFLSRELGLYPRHDATAIDMTILE